MQWIPPGSFMLGSPLTEHRRLPNEDTRTTVRFDQGFWMASTEVTQALFTLLMAENPSHFKGDNLPVDSVTWELAAAFSRRVNEMERQGGRLPPGYSYRLPTEAEWEYAARAGTSTPFSFGSTASPDNGNFHGSYSPPDMVAKSPLDRYGSRPVASFPPNPWGLHDVHGNVAEWTLDRFWDRHPGGIRSHPVNSLRGRGQAVRGGSWKDSADRVRSAAREGVPASAVRNSIGFRLVLAPDPMPLP